MPKSKTILVEGKDDESVVRALLSESQNAETEILGKGSDKQLLASIASELNAPNREVLGIVIDANSNLSARWHQICPRFNNVGIQLPENVNPGGFISDTHTNYSGENEKLIRVGIWIMPDNQSQGELEDFLKLMIPANDPILPHSENYIDGIPTSDRKFASQKETRARVHAWLSAQRDPVLFGTAIRAKFLKTDGELCSSFIAWLERLLSNTPLNQ